MWGSDITIQTNTSVDQNNKADGRTWGTAGALTEAQIKKYGLGAKVFGKSPAQQPHGNAKCIVFLHDLCDRGGCKDEKSPTVCGMSKSECRACTGKVDQHSLSTTGCTFREVDTFCDVPEHITAGPPSLLMMLHLCGLSSNSWNTKLAKVQAAIASVLGVRSSFLAAFSKPLTFPSRLRSTRVV